MTPQHLESEETTATRPDERAEAPTIVAAQRVSKEYTASDGRPFLALKDVSIEVREDEIVALLGTSGSGKSTLLRLLAGLLMPTDGHVTYRGEPVTGPNPGVSMVFQSFALLPWLTVQKNVELGLEAQGVPVEEREKRALEAIDLIGLDGFEQAYPKELSGGMRQRVGFARSLVVEPDALLMDEPFSGLDVLTAENLRGELLRLWDDDQFPTEGILLVTHNIEEAVLLADRVVILVSGPGRIKGELDIDLPRPRDRRAPEFIALTDTIYSLLTDVPDPARDVGATARTEEDSALAAVPLPHASVDGMGGLLDMLVPLGGRDDIPALASRLHLSADDLLPLLDGAQLLGLVTVADADVYLTEEGKELAAADILTAKKLFADAVVERAPLVQSVHRHLLTAEHHRSNESFFLRQLEAYFPKRQARHQLDTAIDWGRYAELFDYDSDTGMLTLDPAQPEQRQPPQQGL